VDHATLLADVTALLARTSTDELRAFAVIARRVMGGGREAYGPLILGNDTRDFAREAGEEIADAFWYLALVEVQRLPTPTASFDVTDGNVTEVKS
jgi:hypothetical protein